MCRYYKHSPCIIPIIVLAEDSDSKHANIDNLPLYLSDSDSFPYPISPNNNKKCNNREDKILHDDNECANTNDDKIYASTTSECKYDKENNEN